jgi:tetratricopeptide (TPR) repeat protein
MRIRSAVLATAAFAVAVPLFAQQQPAAAAQGPKPKSQKEVQALQKVQAAAQQNNPDAEIQAINEVLENFKDTEYKNMLLNMAMDAEARKGDYDQTIVWGERAIQADPNNIQAYDTLAQDIAQHTREHDLDKDKSLQKVNTYANKALDLLKTASAPPTGIPADQWPDMKKDLTAQAHEALGMAAAVDKKYPDAVNDLKTALSEYSKPNAVTMARLAQAYNGAKQYDDAIATADKVLATADAPPSVKQFAQQQKDLATKLKAAPTGATPAPPAK